MFKTIYRTDTDRHVYTLFWDMHSGGGTKTPYEKIYIQAPEAEAIRIFEEEFGQDPHNVGCSCCGPNFAIYEDDSLAEASAFHRNVTISDDGVELWDHRNRSYIDPDEETNPNSWARRWGLTEYCLRPDVLVIQTRDN